MKALVKAHAKPGLWLQEVDKPVIGPEDVLIKVNEVAICGTDLHIYNWDQWAQETIPVPMAVGHEFMGEIVRLGSEVHGLEIGARVAGEGHITCGHCRNCRAGRRHFCHNHLGLGVTRPGAFAEYVTLPAENVFPIPEHIGDEIASVLDPLGNATHTALAFDLVGEDVLITGAGPIGLMAIAIARQVGARFVVITDINPYRLELAKGLGVDRAVDVRSESIDSVMSDLGMTEGFDVGLEMSGAASAFNQMLEAMNHGGSVAVLGIPSGDITVEMNEVIFKGLTVKGIYGRRIFETWYKSAAMLQSGLDISSIVTHTFPAAEFEEAFAVLASGDCGKVVLGWLE